MSNIDQFESAFRSAAKEVFHQQPPSIERVMVITDLDAGQNHDFVTQVKAFLSVLGKDIQWQSLTAEDFSNVAELLEKVVHNQPSLVCTYRHLHSDAWQWPHSLGEHLDVLTQVAECPVLVLPHPDRGGALEHTLKNTDSVMVVTNHITGDERLVNFALALTSPGGLLQLTHVEDLDAFERLLAVIAKIPEIDTDIARRKIRDQLLKEPTEYIQSIARLLEKRHSSVKVESIVTMGHNLAEYKKLISERKVDLLVMNTKDEDQLAMHGLAYPLAVELRSIPLLML